MHLLAISERKEDVEFCKKVAQAGQLQFCQEKDPAQISSFLNANPNTVIFWDVDYEGAEKGHLQNSALAISKKISQSPIPPHRVFAISSSPVSKLEYLRNIRVFGFQVLRQFNDTGAEILGYIAKACNDPGPFGAAKYSSPSNPVQRVLIKDSRQRPPAVTAVENIFLKKGVHPQLCTLLAQSADELLMNAIFDAPLDKNKFPYRRATPRNEAFSLAEHELVTLEFTQNKSYLIVCVSDLFGSLQKDVAIDFLRKDYEDEKYKVDRKTKGAGLGVYGMMQTGLSLLFVCKPGVKTDVLLFIPVVKTMREFRTGFSFFGCIFS